ncbi:uncharacterized protein LOC117641481 isoform X2 [Thrips palmi]|uniref:Uncharacterized protein LOC117641481 isoform X2 n=1 Tax=Thrips palmi TaxID=161013 RepID=A0A6P8Y588_THRPL|nr:uncharacterized protein LOC117641481 isoform X2 [Thrips palmi]
MSADLSPLPSTCRRSTTTFINPATIAIVGPSCCGKTTLALRMLEHEREMFSSPFEHYFWCLPNGSEPPKEIANRPDFQIHYGVPDGATLPMHSIVFLDDLQTEQGILTQLLYTVHSHHRALTVVSLNHNLFPRNRYQRDLSQSTKYIIACNNPRDAASFFRLALQLEPRRARSLYECYLDACKEPFGYLLCDLTQQAHPALRYRTRLFPSDGGVCVYSSDEDVQRLLRENDGYERFCEDKHAPHASIGESQQGSEEATDEGVEQVRGGLPMRARSECGGWSR